MLYDNCQLSRKKRTLAIITTPIPIRIIGPTSVQGISVSLMIHIPIGIDMKKAKLRIPLQIWPRKMSEAPLESPMATMIPGHHQPV